MEHRHSEPKRTKGLSIKQDLYEQYLIRIKELRTLKMEQIRLEAEVNSIKWKLAFIDALEKEKENEGS